MLTMKLTSAKANFFDRKHVQRSVDAADRKALSKFGAFVRTRARTSIRKRKAISAPGMPPSSHVGTVRNLILFAYDPPAKSVVIGPTQSGKGTGAPERLEKGGAVTRSGKILRYRPRPFMGPAFNEERKRVPALWRNSVK